MIDIVSVHTLLLDAPKHFIATLDEKIAHGFVSCILFIMIICISARVLLCTTMYSAYKYQSTHGTCDPY
jgi:hypothetical protein